MDAWSLLSLRWALPLTVVALAAVSAWAWRTRPPTTLVMRTLAHSSAQLAAHPPRETPAWRLDLTPRRDAEPPAWILHEGAQPGQGLELHWQPQPLALQLVRAGDRLQILGTAAVARPPREVAVVRRGLRVTVEVDGAVVLSCLDLLPTPQPALFGFAAATDTGGVVVAYHDEGRFLPPDDLRLLAQDPAQLLLMAEDPEAGALRAVACVRAAILLEPGPAADRAAHDAAVALGALPADDPTRRSLSAWLAWHGVRTALAVGGPDAPLELAVATLVDLSSPDPAPELPGLMLDCIGRLADGLGERPTRPVAPAEALAARARRLAALAELGYAAMDLEGGGAGSPFIASDQQRWMLRLVVQAAECIAGREPQPTPAEGPAWVAMRWRAFAGRDPGLARLPDPPGVWGERNPLVRALARLTAVAGLEPLPALRVREAVIAAIGRDDPGAAEAALAAAPPEAARQVALTRAILALREVAAAPPGRARELPAVERALAALGPALANEDPLGFALDRLLRHRIARAGTRLPGAPAVPEPLAWAARLLSGTREAPADAFRTWPDRPLEALAAALAIQEVAGEAPDWNVLALVPCPTLPLQLLVPEARRAEPPPEEPPPPTPPALP